VVIVASRGDPAADLALLPVLLPPRPPKAHVVKDVVDSYVVGAVKDQVVGGVVEAAGLQGAANQYSNASNSARHQMGQLSNVARFMNQNFFS
jgi:hypothetical protein